jgi:hypothetical protein
MARPWKYDKLITALPDEELFHTAKVIDHGDAQGLFDFSFDDPDRRLSDIEKKNAMKNARSSLAHYVVNRLPKKPDGYVEAKAPARAMYPAWFGATWKSGIAI